MRRALDAWAGDPAVTRIVVTGAGERAFCAGGDIRHLYDLGQAGRHEEALRFWREEYALNVRIKRYPKPYVALIDGIVMGGGVGISLHGSHRVAGERYLFAMPEVGIGFFPDVGATYALPRLPGATGTYLALTGERVRRADALALGLATHAVPSADARRAARRRSSPASRSTRRSPGFAAIRATQQPLRRSGGRSTPAFRRRAFPTILERLDDAAAQALHSPRKTAATIRTKSPTSLAIALEQMRRGRRSRLRGRDGDRVPHRLADHRTATTSTRACAPRSSTRTAPRAGARRRSTTSMLGWSRATFADLGPAELELP